MRKKYELLQIELILFRQSKDVLGDSLPTFGSGEGDDYGTDFWE